MIEICEKHLDWCVLLILVGEGQEIHNGENSGMELWNVAYNKSWKHWEIVYSLNYSQIFDKKSMIDNI